MARICCGAAISVLPSLICECKNRRDSFEKAEFGKEGFLVGYGGWTLLGSSLFTSSFGIKKAVRSSGWGTEIIPTAHAAGSLGI